MRRWYVVALRSTPTTDGRVLLGRIHTRGDTVPLFLPPSRWSRPGARARSVPVPVRVRGGRVEALLRWRDRNANVDLDGPVHWSVDRVEVHDPAVVALTLAGGPNPWPGLPRRAHRSEW